MCTGTLVIGSVAVMRRLGALDDLNDYHRGRAVSTGTIEARSPREEFDASMPSLDAAGSRERIVSSVWSTALANDRCVPPRLTTVF